MEGSTRRVVVWGSVAGGLLVLALVLLSSGMMRVYQRRIDAAPHRAFHRWLQLASADVCRATWRPDLAAERYRKFMQHYPEDPRRRPAMLRFAGSLEAADQTADALAVYQRFIGDYPEGEDTRRARESIDRLRHLNSR